MGRRTLADAGEGWMTVTRRAKTSTTSRRTALRTFRASIFNLFPPTPYISSQSTPFPSSPPFSSSPNTSLSGNAMRPPRSSNHLTPSRQADIAWYSSDPATKEAYSKDPFLLSRIPFQLPAGPDRPRWQNQCFRCLVRGHSAPTCRAPVQACPRCLQPGHNASACLTTRAKAKTQPKKTVDTMAALQQRGNLGDSLLPSNRTPLINVYMPPTADSIDDLHYLTRGVVFDCRLKPGSFNTLVIQTALLLYAPSAAPFPVLRMRKDCFLLLLQGSTPRDAFIASVRSNLEVLGIIPYPWSPAIGAKPIDYQFKVWIDLHDMPIQPWNRRHLLPLVAQFGLVLEHTPFSRVDSIERLRVLVAVRYLEDVPLAARLFFRGLKLPIPLTVLAWVEEPLKIQLPQDPTTPLQYFQDIKKALREKPPPVQSALAPPPLFNSVEVDFEIAFKA